MSDIFIVAQDDILFFEYFRIKCHYYVTAQQYHAIDNILLLNPRKCSTIVSLRPYPREVVLQLADSRIKTDWWSLYFNALNCARNQKEYYSISYNSFYSLSRTRFAFPCIRLADDAKRLKECTEGRSHLRTEYALQMIFRRYNILLPT